MNALWLKNMSIKDWVGVGVVVIGGMTAAIIGWHTMAANAQSLQRDVESMKKTHSKDISEVKQTIKDFRQEHREDMRYIRHKLDSILRK